MFCFGEQNVIFTASWDCTVKMWKLKNNYIDKSYDVTPFFFSQTSSFSEIRTCSMITTIKLPI